MNRVLAVSLATAALALNASGADIGPKPLSYAGQPTPLADMKGIEVEMAAEEVRLVLWKTKLEVQAVFTMVNHGADAEFEEGFPVGPFKNMTEFSIMADGKPVPHRLVDRASSDPKLDRSKEKDPDYFTKERKTADFWYVWNASFKAAGRHTHEVRYTVDLSHQMFYHQTGYVLHTGAAWKNAIGKAVVTLTFGKDCGIQFLRAASPSNARFEADRVVWTFENFEPRKEDDIQIPYALESWKDEIEKERKEAPKFWSVRWSLASKLRQVPSYQGRKKFTPTELQSYLDALGALVSEAKVEEGKYVVPATDPERVSVPEGIPNPLEGMVRSRYYVLESTPAEIFGPLLDEAIAVARDYPEEPKAREVLGACREFVRRLVAGELYLDYRPMANNAKAAAARNVRVVGRPDPKEGKVVLTDPVPDDKRKVLEAKLADADKLLKTP